MNRFLTPLPSVRAAMAALPFAALLVLAATAADGARNPDKPDKMEKPDKFDRMDKAERRANKLDRRDRGDLASSDLPDRTDRRDRNGSAGGTDRTAKTDRGTGPDASPDPVAPPDPQFDSFRLIVERNIFDPNRIGRSRGDEGRPPRNDVIALVGTMQSDKGVVAFFDSPDPTFRKTLREGQSVGGFKVERIAADGVELSSADKPVSLKVAQELRRPEGGTWSVAATEPPKITPGATGAAAGATAASPAEPAPIPPGASEALRRLMEQRQKQLKQ